MKLAFAVVVLLAVPATAHAERLTMRAATDQARDAIFEHAASTAMAFATTKQPAGVAVHKGALIDIRRPRCRALTRTEAVCRYRYTVVEDAFSGVTLYDERGRVHVTRTSVTIQPALRAAATRDGR